jgi:hypothetical protein
MMAAATTSSPAARLSHLRRNAAWTYADSLAATGILVPSSANEAAVIPITTAAATNANGACMPLRPAAAPTNT